MLRSQGLLFGYAGGDKFDFPDIALDSGDTLLIFGASGSGKTTLLFLLAGLLKPIQGSIEINGTNICGLPVQQADSFRGCNIGFIFQKPYFIHSLNLLQNLELIQYLAVKKVHRPQLQDTLNSLGIGDKSNVSPLKMSSGEQQRAMIAMAVCHKPSLILADEPTSNLDDKNCKIAADLLMAQARINQSTLIIVSHDNRLKGLISKQIEL